MVRRDMALVTEENEDFVPGQCVLVLLRQQGIDAAGSIAARQRHTETAADRDGSFGRSAELLDCRSIECSDVRNDLQFGRVRVCKWWHPSP
jgi:hypothetical protein